MKMISRRSLQAFSLIEILIVIVIMAVLAAVLFPRIAGRGRTPAGKATTAMSKANDTECLINIRSARQSLAAMRAGDPDGAPPQSLDELRLPKELTHCAVSKEAYTYDPQTTAIKCPFPAHSGH